MASTSRKSSPIKLVFLFCRRRYEVTCMLFVTPVNKKSHEVELLRTTTVSFPVILFHSKSNQTGIS